MAASHQERRFRQFAVGLAELPATRTTLCQAILLRMGPRGEPCTASYETLAEDTGLGVSTVYRHVRRGVEAGEISRQSTDERRSPDLAVMLTLGEEAERSVRRLWQASRPEEPPPPDWAPTDSLEKDEGWRGWPRSGARIFNPPARNRLRFQWERGIRPTSLPASGRGVAWATSLLWTGGGELLRPTTYGELATLSGYHVDTVRTRIEELERREWMRVVRKRGPGGGLLPWLRLPAAFLYRLRAGEMWRPNP